ncbi:hypothetical protein [Mahella australiensis]|uniref:Lipoprotein n=1 Tax=Mahella australiensis (strain DSM 15567 / CIP 107919 / 50-1 BON) TaxID=697281 RepID=F4A0D3_MAHA5|nr:hypothetical protein [Mahella australiensis]AEE97994.1 hypothetical protein Mahau_2870 [Mahella australiensis 50-1 BON]
MRKISLLVLMIVMLLSGCVTHNSNNKTPSQSNNTNSNSSNTTNNSATEEKIVEKDYSAVFDKKNVKTFLAVLDDGTLWLPVKISDKEICGFTAAVNNKPSKIVIYDIATGKSSTVCTLEDRYQPEFIQFNDTYILWSEYIPYEDGGEQKAVLFNRHTNKMQTLGGEQNSSSGDIQIALGSNYALYSCGTTDKNGNVKFCIYSYDFKTSKTSLFKEDAAMPVIGNNFVAWLGPSKDNLAYSYLYYQDMTSNKATVISPQNMNPQYLGAYGDNLVFSGKTITSSVKDIGAENILTLYQKGKQTVIEKSKGHDYEFPDVSNNYVSWDENRKKRVYSINQKIIIDFPSEYGQAYVSDKYIMWYTDAIPNESKEQAAKDGMYKTIINLIEVQ